MRHSDSKTTKGEVPYRVYMMVQNGNAIVASLLFRQFAIAFIGTGDTLLELYSAFQTFVTDSGFNI